jgi:hypothetical protein
MGVSIRALVLSDEGWSGHGLANLISEFLRLRPYYTLPRAMTLDTIHSGNSIDEEREGLLSGKEISDQPESANWSQRPWSRNHIVGIAVALIFLLIGGAFARLLLLHPPSQRPSSGEGDKLASNGTHDFKKTVLMVSIDGLRCFIPCLCRIAQLTSSI